jgi:hypothetical protein
VHPAYYPIYVADGWCATDASRTCCALRSQSGVDRIFAVATIRSEEHRKSAIRSSGTLENSTRILGPRVIAAGRTVGAIIFPPVDRSVTLVPVRKVGDLRNQTSVREVELIHDETSRGASARGPWETHQFLPRAFRLGTDTTSSLILGLLERPNVRLRPAFRAPVSRRSPEDSISRVLMCHDNT